MYGEGQEGRRELKMFTLILTYCAATYAVYAALLYRAVYVGWGK